MVFVSLQWQSTVLYSTSVQLNAMPLVLCTLRAKEDLSNSCSHKHVALTFNSRKFEKKKKFTTKFLLYIVCVCVFSLSLSLSLPLSLPLPLTLLYL